MQDNQQPSPDFKPLKEDSDYLIYSDGRLFSKKTNRFLKGKIDNVGYHVYALTLTNNMSVSNKKLSKMLYAHRLVAEYFLDNSDNLPYVHHIDENKLNNDYRNLQWVSEKENTVYSRKPRKVEAKYHTDDIDGEIWKEIPDFETYSISSCGRIKNNTTNRLLKTDSTKKYVRIMLRKDGKNHHFYVHRLVYCVFNNDFDLEGFVIDHIDSDSHNNNLSNLQKITQQENCLRQERFNDYPHKE